MVKSISAEEFDRKFDAGEDIADYVDWGTARRLGLESQKVNVDFPRWMVEALDQEAERLKVPRQALIKFIINAHLEENRHNRA